MLETLGVGVVNNESARTLSEEEHSKVSKLIEDLKQGNIQAPDTLINVKDHIDCLEKALEGDSVAVEASRRLLIIYEKPKAVAATDSGTINEVQQRLEKLASHKSAIVSGKALDRLSVLLEQRRNANKDESTPVNDSETYQDQLTSLHDKLAGSRKQNLRRFQYSLDLEQNYVPSPEEESLLKESMKLLARIGLLKSQLNQPEGRHLKFDVAERLDTLTKEVDVMVSQMESIKQSEPAEAVVLVEPGTVPNIVGDNENVPKIEVGGLTFSGNIPKLYQSQLSTMYGEILKLEHELHVDDEEGKQRLSSLKQGVNDLCQTNYTDSNFLNLRNQLLDEIEKFKTNIKVAKADVVEPVAEPELSPLILKEPIIPNAVNEVESNPVVDESSMSAVEVLTPNSEQLLGKVESLMTQLTSGSIEAMKMRRDLNNLQLILRRFNPESDKSVLAKQLVSYTKTVDDLEKAIAILMASETGADTQTKVLAESVPVSGVRSRIDWLMPRLSLSAKRALHGFVFATAVTAADPVNKESAEVFTADQEPVTSEVIKSGWSTADGTVVANTPENQVVRVEPFTPEVAAREASSHFAVATEEAEVGGGVSNSPNNLGANLNFDNSPRTPGVEEMLQKPEIPTRIKVTSHEDAPNVDSSSPMQYVAKIVAGDESTYPDRQLKVALDGVDTKGLPSSTIDNIDAQVKNTFFTSTESLRKAGFSSGSKDVFYDGDVLNYSEPVQVKLDLINETVTRLENPHNRLAERNEGLINVMSRAFENDLRVIPNDDRVILVEDAIGEFLRDGHSLAELGVTSGDINLISKGQMMLGDSLVPYIANKVKEFALEKSGFSKAEEGPGVTQVGGNEITNNEDTVTVSTATTPETYPGGVLAYSRDYTSLLDSLGIQSTPTSMFDNWFTPKGPDNRALLDMTAGELTRIMLSGDPLEIKAELDARKISADAADAVYRLIASWRDSGLVESGIESTEEIADVLKRGVLASAPNSGG